MTWSRPKIPAVDHLDKGGFGMKQFKLRVSFELSETVITSQIAKIWNP